MFFTKKIHKCTYQEREKDPETGKEAFQLRLWDGRIGRWLTSDPKGEFNSPYLGMGNNPMKLIDPDGGSTAPPDRYKLGKNGKVTNVDNKGGDKVDYLIVGNKEITINDTSILPNLQKVNINGASITTTGRENKADIFKIFLAGANYTNVEWTAGTTFKGKYYVGTKYDSGFSPSFSYMGIRGSAVKDWVHSHPDVDMSRANGNRFEAEKRSMGYLTDRGWRAGDWKNYRQAVRDNNMRAPHRAYVYMPESGRL